MVSLVILSREKIGKECIAKMEEGEGDSFVVSFVERYRKLFSEYSVGN